MVRVYFIAALLFQSTAFAAFGGDTAKTPFAISHAHMDVIQAAVAERLLDPESVRV